MTATPIVTAAVLAWFLAGSSLPAQSHGLPAETGTPVRLLSPAPPGNRAAVETMRADAARAAVALVPAATGSMHDRPRKAPYLIVGALAGATLAAVTLYATEPPEATTPLSFVIAVAIPPSALIGAGLGWLIYELRH